VAQLETVVGKETTAYQTKLEQLENKSIKYVFSLGGNPTRDDSQSCNYPVTVHADLGLV
jgi:hypothetical protein